MKKNNFLLLILLSTVLGVSAQEISANGQIHNSCLAHSMHIFSAGATFDDVADSSFAYLASAGINLDDEVKNGIKKIYNFYELSKPLYPQILEKYEQTKSNLSEAYNSGLASILDQFDNLSNYSDESEDAFNQNVVSNFEILRSGFNQSEALTSSEKEQLSITLDVAIGSSIFWNKKFITNPPIQVERKWWSYVGSFIGADILGAGAAMQVTYGVLPPNAYIAAGVVSSAWDALHW